MKIVHFGAFSWIFAKNDIYDQNSTHNPTQHLVRATFKFQHELRAGTEISDEISKNVVNLMKIEYFWGTFMNFSKKYDFGPIFTKKIFLVFRKKYFNFFNKKNKNFLQIDENCPFWCVFMNFRQKWHLWPKFDSLSH